MIYDTLDNLDRYPFLTKIKKIDFNNLSKGKFEVEGDDIFGIGLNYTTKPETDCLWESHRKYLDIHIILEGEEIVNIVDSAQTALAEPYDEAGDYALHEGEKQQSIILKVGSFLALYPNEVHQTAVQIQQPHLVRKVVFKIKL